MLISHVHFGVRDLGSACDWFRRVLRKESGFRNDKMATFVFGEFTVILDACEEDSRATLGFNSSDCDADYRAVLARGAKSIAEPRDQPWGARAAYIKGPATLVIEFEQILTKK